MERYLQSYTIVPKELYVERMADKQIVNIINDMGRPGYVLVARQMGKTNLLLHAKQKMEDDRNIFVYLDFSSIPVYDDRSFFELLINKTIECREHVFSEAADKVTKLRSERIYDSINRYTAELLILLEYVDKIVFVLDEIETLTRNKYSDSIFSQIRSDYFQRVNYPDLYKVTYILSGVFEPKDLIKDPNVSPFNIGEKVYLRSFNRKEMCSFIEKANLPFTEDVKDRIYYWTKGHPRMLNDLCHELQYTENATVDDVDEVVGHSYLAAFDKAPVDGIRRILETDSFLRKSVIQLVYSPKDLSIDAKQKLYLAGIGDYDGTTFEFKNPIIKAALPIDWLKGLDEQKRDVLKLASEQIYFQKKYNDAIELLKKYVAQGDANAEQLNEAYYNLGLCYFRKYETEESLRYLEKINPKVGSEGVEIVMQSYLIKGYNYNNMRMPKECIESYDKIISRKREVNKDLYAKAYIGKVDALVSGSIEEVEHARKLMLAFIDKADTDYYYGYRSISYYELCAIEERLNNNSKASEYLDTAIQYAELSEMPTLLYYKMMLEEDDKQKKQTIDKLLSYLRSYDKKPEIEDFDQMLTLNYYTLACIMSDIILYHEDYIEKFEPFLKWFNNSKEAAYNSIVKHLRNFDDTHALPFAQKILKLSEDGWKFGSDHIFNALSVIYKYKPNIKNALTLYDYIEKNNYTDSREEVARALMSVVKEFIETGKLDKAQSVVNFYRTQFTDQRDSYINALSVVNDYYDAVIQIERGDLEKAREYTDRFVRKEASMTDEDFDLIRPLGRDGVQQLCEDVKAGLNRLELSVEYRKPIVKEATFGRNEMVRAVYYSDGHEVTTKFKKVQGDYEKKLCKVEKI